MLMQSEPTVPTVKIKRVISSDAHKIFNLWTRPELMAHWMSPYPGKVQCSAEADVRVGGTFKLSMQSDHSTCEIEGQYVVVDPPHLLAFTWCGPPTQNANTLVTVELKSISGGTELTLTHEKLPTVELRAAHEIGWANMFDHLTDAVD
jgi:uncharacterized protein YndB with AHSA1/START domain